jgi:dolichyl-diphosphooligosaccharide--protein glycosyltransferase
MGLKTKLILIFILALFFRFLPYPSVFKGNTILFDGPDAYYHVKRILFTVRNFPDVPLFDSYTNYPEGGHIIWPPLFDFLVALIAKGIGLGNPSEYSVEAISAIVPPVIGALTIFWIYQLAREIFNSTVGLYSALFLAILPAHVTVSTVGMTDQHVAEVFCSTFAFVALLKILRRVPASLSLGIGIASCILVWQGSVVFVGFMTCYLLVFLGYQAFQKNEVTLLFSQIVKAYVLALIGIGGITYWNLKQSIRFTILSYVTFSWFHFLFTLLCLILILFLSVALGQWHQIPYKKRQTVGSRQQVTDHRRRTLLLVILSLCLVVLLLLVGMPILKGFLYLTNKTDETVLREKGIILSSSKAWVQTISEYKPLFFINDTLDISYAEETLSRFFYFIPFFWIYFAVKAWKGSQEEFYKLFFLLAWTFLSGFMTLFQHRYTYLFSVICSLYLGFFVTRISDFLKQKESGLSFIYSVLPAIFIIWAFFPCFQYLSGLSKFLVGPPRDLYQTLLQLRQLTPEPGDFYNLNEQPQYGILGNWSFGRWINYIARRPAIADNDGYGFQESIRFFLAEDEDSANRILTERKGRYILVYDLFRALPRYATILGLDSTTYFETNVSGSDTDKTVIRIPKESFYSLMQTRLYEFDGSAIRRDQVIPALEHYRFLYESDSALSDGRPRPVRMVKVFEYVPGARIIGKTKPGSPVSILLNVQTNQPALLPDAQIGQRRIFLYWNVTMSDAHGNFKFTVPYATNDSLISVRTSDYYLLKCGSSLQQISVSEEAVRNGKDVVLENICES